jgi:cell division transport system permease protein
MKAALLGFVLRRVRRSLWQSRWTHLLTTGTLAIALFVFGAFVLVQRNIEHQLKGWGDQLEITAYLKNEADSDTTARLVERVHSWPGIARVQVIDREQAWHDFQLALGSQSGLLDGLPRNILPISLDIKIQRDQSDDLAVRQFAERLKKEPEIAFVEYPQEWVERLSLISLAVSWAKWLVGGVLFLATFFIVGSMAKLALTARRDEVEILQLIGASEGLIQAPFLLEGMILGFAGAVLSLGTLWGVHLLLEAELPALGLWPAPAARLQFLDRAGAGLLIAIGWLLGSAGSLFPLRRFVRAWKPLDGAS